MPVWSAAAVTLAPSLRAIIDDGFTERDGRLLLTRYVGEAERTPRGWDAVAVEAAVNHVHIEGHVDRDPVAQGAAYADALAAALRARFADRDIRVIASVGDSVVVRFHVERPGASSLADDLDGYASEAVLTFLA